MGLTMAKRGRKKKYITDSNDHRLVGQVFGHEVHVSYYLDKGKKRYYFQPINKDGSKKGSKSYNNKLKGISREFQQYVDDHAGKKTRMVKDPTDFKPGKKTDLLSVGKELLKPGVLKKYLPNEEKETRKAIEELEATFQKVSKEHPGYKFKSTSFTIPPKITEDFIIREFLKLLQDDPDRISHLTGMTEFAKIKDVKIEVKLSLKSIGLYYLDRHQYRADKKGLSHKVRRDATNWWSEFCKVVNKERVDDLTLKDIQKYMRYIIDTQQKKNYSAYWVKRRYDIVKTILKNALDMVDNTEPIQEALKHCRKFIYPQGSGRTK